MDKDKLKAFADKVFGDMAGAMAAGMGYVGVKTGLFRAMAGKGPMRVEDVAREAKLVPRYVEEWLKGMTSAKYLDYDPVAKTYRLPDEHAYLLASDDSDHFMGGLFPIVPVLLRLAPDVAIAFERGGGVPFEKFGPEGVCGLDIMNRVNTNTGSRVIGSRPCLTCRRGSKPAAGRSMSAAARAASP